MLKGLLLRKADKYRAAGQNIPEKPEPGSPASKASNSSVLSHATVLSEGGTKAESPTLIRVAVLLIDELRVRLRRCFELQWLLKIGVAWGDNPVCGECFCQTYRSSLAECKDITMLDRDLLLRGQIALMPIHSLFSLLLNVVTNRQRRVDGQPRYLARIDARPPNAARRPYGVNHWNPPEPGDIEVTRRCETLQTIHRDFFRMFNEYKRLTTKQIPSKDRRQSAVKALARSATMRFSQAAKTAETAFYIRKNSISHITNASLQPQSSFRSKDSCGISPLSGSARRRDSLHAGSDPRLLARSDDYLASLFDKTVSSLRSLGPDPHRTLVVGLSWEEFRDLPLEQVISERVVSRECHAALSGLCMRNDPYRDRLQKTMNDKRKLMAAPVSKVIAARRMKEVTREAMKVGGRDASEENKIYRQGLRNARRSLTLHLGPADDDDLDISFLDNEGLS